MPGIAKCFHDFHVKFACPGIDHPHGSGVGIFSCLNTGKAVENFDEDEVVEVSCRITKDGPVPVKIGSLPKATNGLIQQIKSFEVASVEAAVSGDYDKTLLAMMINPLVSSQKYGVPVLEELLMAHRKYLPQFAEWFAKKDAEGTKDDE